MQVAKHEWKQSWANYLASSRGWIVAQIDGRGSGGEGDRRRFEIWHQLGSVEVADQVMKSSFQNNTKHKFAILWFEINQSQGFGFRTSQIQGVGKIDI